MTTPLSQEAPDLDIAELTVLEILYDGEHLFLTVEVTPKRDDILFINEVSTDPEGPDAYLRDLGPRFADSDERVVDYLEANGLSGYRLDIRSDRPEALVSEPFAFWSNSHLSYEEDGSIIVLVDLSHEGTGIDTIDLRVVLHPVRITPSRKFMDEGDADAWQYRTMSVEVDLSHKAPVFVSTEAFVLEKFGFRIDEVRFVYTKMATYVYFISSISDRGTYEGLRNYLPSIGFEGTITGDYFIGLPWPTIYSDDGKRLPSAAYGSSGMSDSRAYALIVFPAMDPADTSYRMEFAFAPDPTASISTGLSETHTVELTKQSD